MSAPTGWSNELIIEFLTVYEKYPVIWDPKDSNHNNRNTVADAWLDIRNQLSIDIQVDALKKKKESLMTTYRTLKKKVRCSMKSGSGIDDIYKPTWFAYNIMDKFLGRKGKINATLKTEVTEENDMGIDDGNEIREKDPFDELSDENQAFERNATMQSRAKMKVLRSPPKVNVKRKAVPTVSDDEIHNNIKRACPAVNMIAQRPSHKQVVADECSLFGELLATKLRALSIRTRKILINKIDNLVFEAEMTEIDERSNNNSAMSQNNLDSVISAHSPI